MRRAARPVLYAGAAVIVLALAKVHAAWIGHYDFTGSFRFAWTLAYLVLLGLAAYGAGLPDLVRAGRSAAVAAVGAAVGAALGVSAVELLAGDALLPRFVVFGSAVLLVPWYLLCTAIAQGGRSRAEDRDRVVVVATPADVLDVREELARAAEQPATIVGELRPQDAVIETPSVRPLCELVIAEAATVVVLDRTSQGEASIVAQAAALHEAGVRVRTLSLFYEEWLGKLPVNELERVSLMFDIGEVHRALYGRVKRVLDVFVATAGAVALGLLIPVVVVANLVANRGPLFYRQTRVGKNGRRFQMLKFRTMNADGDVSTNWTEHGDPRITPFGRLLRVTHFDELPQVVNILRGDLSVVGPRPEQVHYVEELTGKLPFYGLRHLVRPGLTGWAQVKYGYAGSESDALEKLQYEFWYLRHQGLSLDVRIIGRTVRSVLGREGRGR
jgi:lipopolysaccharide/colanic/teichoic acid biosynthesis glycosyltransferase